MEKTTICLEVSNFAEAYERDHSILDRLGRELARLGAIPTRVDFPTRTYCVSVEAPDLIQDEVVAQFTAVGLIAHVKGV